MTFTILSFLALYFVPTTCKHASVGLDIGWLSYRAKQIVQGCEVLGVNHTVLFTPDASHHYARQWTRDFYYTIFGAAEIMEELMVKSAVAYQFSGQRADGCMPDRMRSDGGAEYNAGLSVDHAWDNGPFAALLLSKTVEAWPDRAFFCKFEPAVRRALDFVNRSANGLVFNDPLWPNATYGFTDSIAKTGNILFTSLLFIDANLRMAALAENYGCGGADKYRADAAKASTAIDAMKDADGPFWLAASVDNALPDVWGTAYLVSLGLSTASRRQLAMREIVEHKDLYFSHGQARHLPSGMFWNRCCFSPHCAQDATAKQCAPRGTYQNGAFWATPHAYLIPALLSTGNSAFAIDILSACIDDFKKRGIYENVNDLPNRTLFGVLNYTASVVNVYWAARLIQKLSPQTQVVPILASSSIVFV